MKAPPIKAPSPFPHLTLWEWLFPLGAVAALAALSSWSYLLFHVTAELFIAAIGLMMFFVSSSAARFGQSHFLLILGAGFFWVSVLEIFHCISYKGMNILFDGSANEATQLWLAARLLEALTLVTAPLFIGRRASPMVAFLGFGLLAAISAWAVVAGHFPDAYRELRGMTPFKIAMEWLAIALLGVAALLLWTRREELPPRSYHLLMAALVLSTLAELAFTLYTGVYTSWNVSGHLIIFLAFWLFFLATVKTMMTEPFIHVTQDATILELSPDPTVLITQDYQVKRLNLAAQRAFGEPSSSDKSTLFKLVGPSGHWSRSPTALARDMLHLKGTEAPQAILLQRGEVWYDVRIQPLEGSILGKSAIALFRDITESKHAQDILLRSNAELEQFAHVLSHELQTPIRSIVSYLGLIQRRLGIDLSQDIRQDMEMAVQAGKRMSAMIHGLLDYANARPSDHPLVPVKLTLPLTDALSALEPRLKAWGTHVATPERLPTVLGNRDQLVHVFQELLENASKFTPADRTPEISITATESEEQVHLSFTDNGMGIPDKDRQVVFGVFKRLHGETEFPGTGLGLAICKRLIELHGGWITLRPRMGTEGSVFTVTLWKESAAAPLSVSQTEVDKETALPNDV
ncbi:MASE3 domain-containing protein [Rhodospirillum sp. A1_3_36]|uniref:MASE3 domain-containing protein n=1 Tax=Rhodospirillum sp. A1_3_36 TaxID=3391666 RepID=UPI0039A5E856